MSAPTTQLDLRATQYANTTRAQLLARNNLRDEVRNAVIAGGMSEAEAARRAGVSRMTIRTWLGK